MRYAAIRVREVWFCLYGVHELNLGFCLGFIYVQCAVIGECESSEAFANCAFEFDNWIGAIMHHVRKRALHERDIRGGDHPIPFRTR